MKTKLPPIAPGVPKNLWQRRISGRGGLWVYRLPPVGHEYEPHYFYDNNPSDRSFVARWHIVQWRRWYRKHQMNNQRHMRYLRGVQVWEHYERDGLNAGKEPQP